MANKKNISIDISSFNDAQTLKAKIAIAGAFADCHQSLNRFGFTSRLTKINKKYTLMWINKKGHKISIKGIGRFLVEAIENQLKDEQLLDLVIGLIYTEDKEGLKLPVQLSEAA